jgi:hypothetical protein
MPRLARHTALVALAAGLGLSALTACGATRPADPDKPIAPKAPPRDNTPQLGAVAAGSARPLGTWATRPVAVYALQRLAPGDSAGWTAAIADPADVQRRFDDELRFALEQRRGIPEWKQLPDLERAAKRATPFSPALRDLPVEPLTGKLDERLRTVPAPLAESIRMIGGLTGIRWALVPAQLKFVAAPGGQRAAVRLVLVDARTGEIGFAADVLGEPAAAFGPGVIASVAQRVADQFVAP